MLFVLWLDPDLPDTATPEELVQFAVDSVKNNPGLQWDIMDDASGLAIANNVSLPAAPAIETSPEDEPQQAGTTDDSTPARPRTTCGCGYDLVWVDGEWTHDAARELWGDDHSPDPDEEPEPQARAFWDREDRITA